MGGQDRVNVAMGVVSIAGPGIVPGGSGHRRTDWVQLDVTVTDEQPGFALNEA